MCLLLKVKATNGWTDCFPVPMCMDTQVKCIRLSAPSFYVNLSLAVKAPPSFLLLAVWRTRMSLSKQLSPLRGLCQHQLHGYCYWWNCGFVALTHFCPSCRLLMVIWHYMWWLVMRQNNKSGSHSFDSVSGTLVCLFVCLFVCLCLDL